MAYIASETEDGDEDDEDLTAVMLCCYSGDRTLKHYGR